MSISLAQLKKRFKTTDWYKQGGSAKLLYPSYSAAAGVDFRIRGKRLPYFYKGFAFYETEGNFWHIFLAKREMLKNARYYLAQQRRDPKFISAFMRHWEQVVVKPFLGALRHIERSDLGSFSDRELIVRFLSFSKAYGRIWSESIFLDAFDYASDILLPELLVEFKVSLSQEELALFLSPEKLSWIQREKQSLLSLASRAAPSRGLSGAIKRNTSIAAIERKYPAWFRRLERHAAAHHWIYNDYAVVRNLGPAHFLREIRTLLTNPRAAAAERANLARTKSNAVLKRRLARSLRISKKLGNLFSFFVTLTAFRDSRKAYNQMANGAISAFVKELSVRSGVAAPLVEEALWWEITGVSALRKLVPELRARKTGNLFYNDRGRHVAVCCGTRARELFGALERSFGAHAALSGKPAFAGVVRGTVRLVRSQSEFKKMKKGNILVAPNTRPEYVPIMKMAGAIVTEEGGITSHASIVSRELRVPCIVGVQGVTSILKDGDRVEVDADKGIVRKL